MRSMTGFAEGNAADASVSVTIGLRTVNHRGLDVAMRLRDDYRAFESGVRRQISERLARGRVDVSVEITMLDPALRTTSIDAAAVAAYLAAGVQLSRDFGIGGELSLADVVRLPDVIRSHGLPSQARESVERQLEAAVDQALDLLIADREREGEALGAILGELLTDLESRCVELRERAPVAIEAARLALTARLDEALGGVELDPARLAQEVAVLADRADIREELDRLGVHLDALREALSAPGAVGKRLEALLQEVLRELSTTGAKSRDAALKAVVIEARLSAESMKEQIANVE